MGLFNKGFQPFSAFRYLAIVFHKFRHDLHNFLDDSFLVHGFEYTVSNDDLAVDDNALDAPSTLRINQLPNGTVQRNERRILEVQ